MTGWTTTRPQGWTGRSRRPGRARRRSTTATRKTLSIAENHEDGAAVGTVAATDADGDAVYGDAVHRHRGRVDPSVLADPAARHPGYRMEHLDDCGEEY